jgi:hypothetical protein
MMKNIHSETYSTNRYVCKDEEKDELFNALEVFFLPLRKKSRLALKWIESDFAGCFNCFCSAEGIFSEHLFLSTG